jgi:hypothetical protein
MGDDAFYAALAVSVLVAARLPRACVDIFVLARALGLRLTPTTARAAELDGDAIRYDGTAPLEQQRWLIAESVAEHVLRERGADCGSGAKRSLARAWIAPSC